MSAFVAARQHVDRNAAEPFADASGIAPRIAPDTRQADFAAALLDPALPVPHGLVGPDGKPSTRRFNVYRNNIAASLTRVLRAAFPATARLVGEDFFAAMARAHIARQPPASPMLFDYGAEFPEFIATFVPAASLPYLCDVARIERAWVEAYHAADAHAIAPEDFARMRPDDLPDMRVIVHPSVRIVRSKFPALTIWRANTDDALSPVVNLAAGSEDALIARPDADVEVYALLPGGADFVRALGDGNSMLDAMNAAIVADPCFDPPANVAMLLSAGLLVDVTSIR